SRPGMSSAGSDGERGQTYRFDGARLPVRGAPPVLGADTEAVLGGWLGMSADEVARLRADRVV
ncbi:CoA transferase, partial [Burkholderia cepacia]|nr:CoA transferase [Burkholderia cepacia]